MKKRLRRPNKFTGYFRLIGFRTDNIKRGIIPYFITAAVACAGLHYFINSGGAGRDAVKIWKAVYYFPFAAVITGFLQELLLRGMLFPVIYKYTAKAFNVIITNAFISGIVYLLIFIFIPQYSELRKILIMISFPAGFITGGLIAWAYYYCANLWLAFASRLVIVYSILIFCG